MFARVLRKANNGSAKGCNAIVLQQSFLPTSTSASVTNVQEGRQSYAALLGTKILSLSFANDAFMPFTLPSGRTYWTLNCPCSSTGCPPDNFNSLGPPAYLSLGWLCLLSSKKRQQLVRLDLLVCSSLSGREHDIRNAKLVIAVYLHFEGHQGNCRKSEMSHQAGILHALLGSQWAFLGAASQCS